jgi:hypothetical protein
MAKKNRNKAKKMASRGASVKEIRKATGVKQAAAKKFTQRTASRTAQTTTPNDQGPPGNTAPRTAPNISTSRSPSTSSRSTPEIKGVGQGLRVSGERGISKRDFKTIAEAKGNNPEKIIAKLDKINTKLETKGKAGIDLKSGAANMLIKKAQKSSDKYRGFRTPDFGDGAIGSTLQSMLSTPGNAGTWIKGRLTGVKEGDPGFNPGGRPDKNRMIGGTVIRANGKIANKGVGEQYELPKRFREDDEVIEETEEDPIVEEEKDPIEEDPIEEDPIEEEEEGPIEEEEEVDKSASSGAGGLDLASWATGFKKARSARQKSGRSAQGLASQKKNPFKSWA